MTRDNAKKEYLELLDRSGLEPTAFKERCRLLLPDRGNGTPEQWIVAARQVLAEVQAAVLAPKARGAKLLALPPSYIVTQEVSVKGAISYERIDEQVTARESARGVELEETVKTTKKTVTDPDEYKLAMQLGAQLRSELRKIGQVLQGGVLLVPTARAGQLEELILSSRQRAEEFNAKAQYHFVRVRVLKALITSDAEQAARDVAYTIQTMLEEMKSALRACDVKRIREIAQNAKSLTKILPVEEAGLLGKAIEQARKSATWINTELVKKGQSIDAIRSEVEISAIDTARLAFLDFSIPAEMAVVKPAVDAARFVDCGEGTSPQSTLAAPAVDAARFSEVS